MASIALLGGSFDPPHFGHLNCINLLLESKLIEQVWLVPSAKHKDKNMQAGITARKEMLQILLSKEYAGDARVKLDFRQMQNSSQASRTIELLEELQQEYREHEFWFVIGSDLVTQLANWHRAEELRKQAKFLVVPRPNFQAVAAGFNLKILEVAEDRLTDTSSSLLREIVAKGGDISTLCPSYIAEYISENKLYVK